jgi:shikimate dehydrogenase
MGWPIGHSLSPALHAYWLRELKIDGAYVALPVMRETFASALRGLRDAGFAGVNVTVPHKESAYAIAHELDEIARLSGAVNVLVFRGDRFIGRNTDVEGLVASLAETLGAKAVQGRPVVLLGSGGAARAAVLACDQLRASAIRVVCRHPARGEGLIAALKGRVSADLSVTAWSDVAKATNGAALLVNATSAGMKGNAALTLSLEALPADAAVCDIVYNPLETELLQSARLAGHCTVDGLGMLMHQAVPAFELFYGARPKVSAGLRRALEQALGHAG